MKKISSYNNDELRDTQFEMLIDAFLAIKDRDDLKLFLNSFLSESEKAYLSQRLDLMRMLARKLSYREIMDNIKASAATISNAKKCLDSGGEQLEFNILKIKPKTKKYKLDEEIAPLIIRKRF